jgi:hypothetical protein
LEVALRRAANVGYAAGVIGRICRGRGRGPARFGVRPLQPPHLRRRSVSTQRDYRRRYPTGSSIPESGRWRLASCGRPRDRAISPGERQATTVTRGHPDAQVSGPGCGDWADSQADCASSILVTRSIVKAQIWPPGAESLEDASALYPEVAEAGVASRPWPKGGASRSSWVPRRVLGGLGCGAASVTLPARCGTAPAEL